MLLINFSHPVTDAQLQEIQRRAGQTLRAVIDVPAQVDLQRSLADQVRELIDSIGLTPDRWQTEPLLVKLPSLEVIAGCVLAELHGRMGYFPPMMRLRPVSDSLPPRFEVAEIINLQTVREDARLRR